MGHGRIMPKYVLGSGYLFWGLALGPGAYWKKPNLSGHIFINLSCSKQVVFEVEHEVMHLQSRGSDKKSLKANKRSKGLKVELECQVLIMGERLAKIGLAMT